MCRVFTRACHYMRKSEMIQNLWILVSHTTPCSHILYSMWQQYLCDVHQLHDVRHMRTGAVA